MAESFVWEGDDVPVRANVLGSKYASTKKVEFVFVTDDSNEVALGSTSVALAQNVATGVWSQPKAPKDVTGSTFDETAYRAKFSLNIDGQKIMNFTDKVWVYAKTITVTALDPDDGSKVVGAKCKITQTGSGDGGWQYTAIRETDSNGQIVFTLKYPAPATLEWQRPWVGKWTPGKDKGANREAKVSYGAKMKILTPVKPTDGSTYKQFVNLDANTRSKALDEEHPDWGHVLTVEVGPAGDENAVVQGMMVYLRATFDAANSTREGAAAAAGQVWQDAQPLNDQLVATFKVELGHAGGDKIKIEVGGCGQKSGQLNPNKPTFTADDSVDIITWRRLFYEMLVPQSVIDAGKVIAATLDDGTDSHDLSDAIRTWVSGRLGTDKGFVEYKCNGATVFDLADANADRFVDGGCLGATAGKNIYVLGGTQPDGVNGVTWNGTDPQTVYMRLCDWAVSPQAIAPFATAPTTHMTAASQVFAVPNYLLPKNMNTGRGSITDAKWYAELPPSAKPDHPGRVSNGGVAKSGDIPPEWFDFTAKRKLKITLDGEAKALAGAASDTTCPIRISLKWATVGLINGNSGDGQQLMSTMRAAEPIGCTICHELAHSMGLTVFESNGQGKRKQTPKGLPFPTPAASGGDVYDNTHGHNGSHCATGYPGRPSGSGAFTFTEKGKAGTCIMFGQGGDEVPQKRDQFCAQCLKYVKARKLDDIKKPWDTRNADDC